MKKIKTKVKKDRDEYGEKIYFPQYKSSGNRWWYFSDANLDIVKFDTKQEARDFIDVYEENTLIESFKAYPDK